VTNASIAPSTGEVKRSWAASQRDTRDVPRRPDVLRKMPPSCNVVFDVLRTFAMGEAVELPVRELAQMCRLSSRQTRRALARLHGAHLIRWQRNGPGRGHCSIIEVLWENPSQRPRNRLQRLGDISLLPHPPRRAKAAISAGPAPSPAAASRGSDDLTSFPQEKGAPQKSRSEECFGFPSPYTQGFKAFSHPDSRPQLTSRAHRWAMARLREAVRACPVPWPRRNRLLEAMGTALWRAIARGEVTTREELAYLVHRLRTALWREQLPQSRRALHAWAGWTIHTALDELIQEIAAARSAQQLVDQIRREREAARVTWAARTRQANEEGEGGPAGFAGLTEPSLGELTSGSLQRAPGGLAAWIPRSTGVARAVVFAGVFRSSGIVWEGTKATGKPTGVPG